MSSPQLQVSLGLWQDRPPEEALLTAAVADELGYPAVWIGEMATYDTFALATLVGARLATASLVLGPFAVTVRDPMMIAMGTASVAALTGRPTAVGLGTSSRLLVEEWHGRSHAGAARALDESARTLRRLLDGERSDVVGTVVGSRGYHLRLPAPRSDLIVAAFGDRAITVAAEHADRMVLNLVTAPLAHDLVQRLAAAAERAGRQAPRVACWVGATVGDDRAGVDQLRRSVVGYLGATGYSDMFERAGYAELVAYARTRPHPRDLLAAVPDDLVGAVGIVGDEDTAARRVREYADAGVDDVVIVPASTESDPGGRRTLSVLARLASGSGERSGG